MYSLEFTASILLQLSSKKNGTMIPHLAIQPKTYPLETEVVIGVFWTGIPLSFVLFIHKIIYKKIRFSLEKIMLLKLVKASKSSFAKFSLDSKSAYYNSCTTWILWRCNFMSRSYLRCNRDVDIAEKRLRFDLLGFALSNLLNGFIGAYNLEVVSSCPSCSIECVNPMLD